MIQINEIRNGNLFKFYKPLSKAEFEIMKVEGFYYNVEEQKYLIVNDQYPDLTLQGFKGIDLDENWLLRFGFKKSVTGVGDNYVEYFEHSKLTVCNWGDGFIMSNAFSHGIRVELKFVHQLQNLFFCITNSDLQSVS